MPPTEALDRALDFAREIAGSAGEIALGWFRSPVTVGLKEDLSPVTEADRAVEEHLRNRIHGSYPGHAILGEEFGHEGAAGAPVWVVDPIDGTRSFITGWPIWGTLVALVQDDLPRPGVIHLPAMGETRHARQGGGAYLTGRDGSLQPCRTSSCRKLSEARFYTTSPDYFDEDEHHRFIALSRAAAVQRYGGDCYSYGLLASGHVDLVMETRLQPYDFLALVPVIEEAGGVITDWQGRGLRLESGYQVLAAATPELHAEALSMISARNIGDGHVAG
ncbi:inositol monophosphatase family protein [Rhodobacter sp.]